MPKKISSPEARLETLLSESAPDEDLIGLDLQELQAKRVTKSIQRLDDEIATWTTASMASGEEAKGKIESLQRLRGERDYLSKWLAINGFGSDGSPLPFVGKESDKRWTTSFIEEVRTFRTKHTEKQTAEKYGVSGTLIRRKLAPPKKLQAQPFSGLGARSK